jgi:hypothetical protein
MKVNGGRSVVMTGRDKRSVARRLPGRGQNYLIQPYILNKESVTSSSH